MGLMSRGLDSMTNAAQRLGRARRNATIDAKYAIQGAKDKFNEFLSDSSEALTNKMSELHLLQWLKWKCHSYLAVC